MPLTKEQEAELVDNLGFYYASQMLPKSKERMVELNKRIQELEWRQQNKATAFIKGAVNAVKSLSPSSQRKGSKDESSGHINISLEQDLEGKRKELERLRSQIASKAEEITKHLTEQERTIISQAYEHEREEQSEEQGKLNKKISDKKSREKEKSWQSEEQENIFPALLTLGQYENVSNILEICALLAESAQEDSVNINNQVEISDVLDVARKKILLPLLESFRTGTSLSQAEREEFQKNIVAISDYINKKETVEGFADQDPANEKIHQAIGNINTWAINIPDNTQQTNKKKEGYNGWRSEAVRLIQSALEEELKVKCPQYEAILSCAIDASTAPTSKPTPPSKDCRPQLVLSNGLNQESTVATVAPATVAPATVAPATVASATVASATASVTTVGNNSKTPRPRRKEFRKPVTEEGSNTSATVASATVAQKPPVAPKPSQLLVNASVVGGQKQEQGKSK